MKIAHMITLIPALVSILVGLMTMEILELEIGSFTQDELFWFTGLMAVIVGVLLLGFSLFHTFTKNF